MNHEKNDHTPDPELKERFADQTDIELKRKIAEGGMGNIYEASLHGTENFVKNMALKTIRPNLTDNEEFVSMFVGEAKLVANLVHLNIVQIYNLSKIDELYYISMEYVHGITLEEFLKRHLKKGKEIPYDLATFIVTRVAKALEYAHTKRDRNGEPLNVVHRDVSPGNIMISSEGVIKLTDFGISKARNYMMDQEGELLMGKIPYMSPEQAQFEETDHRADLFSLGTVFHELVTRRPLFDSASTQQLMEEIIREPIPDPHEVNPDVPERINDVIVKLLQRDPADRYQSAGTLAEDLERYMYEPGFGPTYDKLRDYMQDLYPELFTREDRKPVEEIGGIPPDATTISSKNEILEGEEE